MKRESLSQGGDLNTWPGNNTCIASKLLSKKLVVGVLQLIRMSYSKRWLVALGICAATTNCDRASTLILFFTSAHAGSTPPFSAAMINIHGRAKSHKESRESMSPDL